MNNTFLIHHGIKGMHWGVRRFQNKDGSYTSDGKSRRRTHTLSKQQARNLKDAAQIAGGVAAIYGLYKVANPKGNAVHDLKNKIHSNIHFARQTKDFVKNIAHKKYSKEDLKRMSVDTIYGKGTYDWLKSKSNKAKTKVKSKQQGASLMHYGIKGQKWGVRRYQNPDGSYTSAGKARINTLETKSDFNIFGRNRIRGKAEYRKIKNNHQKAKDNYLKNKNEKNLKILRKARNKRLADIAAFKVAPKVFLLNNNKVRGRYYKYRDQGSIKTLSVW